MKESFDPTRFATPRLRTTTNVRLLQDFLQPGNMIHTKLYILSFLYLEQSSRLPNTTGTCKCKESLSLSGLGSVSSSVASGIQH